ncbi:MAG: hypothetical protein CFE21_22840 [Bacteroidetes bacterium B1(2017)]|nr:MAG: hypothetical protein CFE21_22840 [Bacteroidetes bacterium B1(2017)]
MKNFVKILIFSLFAFTTYAQQVTEIDSKSVKLPRYADQAAVTAAIPTPTQGMLIYRTDTKSNWYHNGANWINMLSNGSSDWLSIGPDIYRDSQVGIGNTSPEATLHVGIFDEQTQLAKGNIRSEGNIDIGNRSYLVFGKKSAKDIDNEYGRIGYNLHGDQALDIIGAGIVGKEFQQKLNFFAPKGNTFRGQVSIFEPYTEKVLRVSNSTQELFAVSEQGLNIRTNPTQNGKAGTVLINAFEPQQIGKWGFDNVGSEMIIDGQQTINHNTDTKINFGVIEFDHNNFTEYEFGNPMANTSTDVFTVPAFGVYLVDFDILWNDPLIDIGGTGIRNGRVKIKVNGVTRREFVSDLKLREHCFIKCNQFDIITIEVGHEHCFDPPPLCITGISRKLDYARVTVMKF